MSLLDRAIAAGAVRRHITGTDWEVHAGRGPLGWAVADPSVVARLDQMLAAGTVIVDAAGVVRATDRTNTTKEN
jgi:hypothetical protein